MFGINIGSAVKQTATFILAVIFLAAATPPSILKDIINVITSLDVPSDWRIGFGIFGFICFLYTVIF